MSEKQYKAAIAEVFQIEAVLMEPARRKDVRLILRHMTLCRQIHAYDQQLRPTPAGAGKAAAA